MGSGKPLHFKKLALGTVQFGTPYGVTNSHGQTSHDEAIKTMRLAYDSGIQFFDTARAYGTAEHVLGEFLMQIDKGRVLVGTKLAPIENDSAMGQRAEESLRASLAALGRTKIDIFMYHRWANHKNAEIRSRVLALHEHYEKLGVSALNIEEAIEALHDSDIKFIQMPCNLLDGRPLESKFQDIRRSRPDVEIQLRSVLLQGVLTESFDPIKQKIAGHDIGPMLKIVDRLVVKLDRVNRRDLAYAYALGLDWAQSLVFGVESSKQLGENLKLFTRPPLSRNEIQTVRDAIGFLAVPEEVLNPYQWKLIDS